MTMSRAALDWEPSRRQGVFLRRSEYEVLYGGAKMGGKSLDINTVLITPDGETTMGAIQVGDRLYDEEGRVCNVIFKSEVFTDHRVYHITFRYGGKFQDIKADAGHVWPMWNGVTKTTEELKEGDTLLSLDTEDSADGWDVDGIDEIPSIPVQCIAVDSPSHLYLASESMIPTHNTDVLLTWQILRRQKYKGSRGLFIRRQISDILKQGAAWERAHELLGDRVTYNGTHHTITFPNGSVLEFGHCKDEESKQNYQGSQYDDICYDQLEQFSYTMYTFISAACRVPLGSARPKDSAGNEIQPKVRASANPGSIGHSWVKSRFVDIATPETPYTYTETIRRPDGTDMEITRDRVFVPSLLFDNPYADPAYAATLNQLPENLKLAYLYGRWDVFVGQAFPDFKPRLEDGTPWHVIPTGSVPNDWMKLEGHDFGFNSPFYHCWGALDPDGGVIIYKEMTARQWKSNEIASQVLIRRGQDHISTTYTDNYVFQSQRSRMTQQMEQTLEEKGQLMRSINEQYIEAGLTTCVLVPNMDRIAGKMKIHALFGDRGDNKPYLRIMDNCPVLIKTLAEIPLDEERVEDVETHYPPDAEVADHPYDGLRYLVVGANIPIRPLIPKATREEYREPIMSWGKRRR